MMAQATEAPPEKRRPRHQIKRSITELAAPVRLPRHHNQQQQQQQQQQPDEQNHAGRRHHHLGHGHGHSLGHNYLRKSDRDDKPNRQSANFAAPLGRASADMPRSESSSYFGDLDPSRRESPMVPIGDLASAAATRKKMAGEGNAVMTKEQKEALLRQEQADAVNRAALLKNSFEELNNFSTETHQKLDDSYYSVLERLGTLQNTVVALKELASLSSELNRTFQADTHELVDEVEGQVQPFSELDEQQERIKTLQGRISVGRDKAKVLSERVDRVRERVDGWETADKAWRQSTRKRLKVVWIVVVTAAIVLVLLVLLGSHHDKVASTSATLSSSLSSLTSSLSARPQASVDTGGPDRVPAEAGMAQDANGVVGSVVDEVREALQARAKHGGGSESDVLRVLDEL